MKSAPKFINKVVIKNKNNELNRKSKIKSKNFSTKTKTDRQVLIKKNIIIYNNKVINKIKCKKK